MSYILYLQLLCPQMLKERERNRREEDHNPTAAYNHSISASFSATTYTTYILHTFTPPPSLCYIHLHPFPQQHCCLSLFVHFPKFIQSLYGPHICAQIIQQHLPISLKFHTTHQGISHTSPTLLSHITHLSLLNILHIFLSPNNPALPVLSLNNKLNFLTLY